MENIGKGSGRKGMNSVSLLRIGFGHERRRWAIGVNNSVRGPCF